MIKREESDERAHRSRQRWLFAEVTRQHGPERSRVEAGDH